MESLDGRAGRSEKLNTMATKNIFKTAATGDETSLLKLIEKGADVNARDEQGLPPLHYAAYRSHLNTLKLLLAHGAEVNTCNDIGYTPLMVASREGWTETVRLLLEHGADVNATTHDGHTALYFAATFAPAEVVRLLLESGAEATGNALLGAAHSGQSASVRLLLDAGVELYATTRDGKTALALASEPGRAESGRAEVRELLRQAGATH